jgi:hypothetical protein
MRLIRYLTLATLAGAVLGCMDLEVTNPSSPDRPRILKTPADVEGLASAQFQQIISGTIGNIARVQTGMMTASFMNASGLANNGMGPRSNMPRTQIDNARGNTYTNENYNDFRILSSVARNSADILARAKSADFNLGAGRDGDLNRLKAFSHFTYGVSVGYLSMVYDSTEIPRPSDDANTKIPLEGYKDVNAHELAQLDSALVYLAASGTTAIPAGWFGPGGSAISVSEFARIVRSYRAQIRAGVARGSAERAAVDWDKVIADAEAGIQADFTVGMTPSQNWDYQWLGTTLHFRDANWHQMPYHIIGMADVSGGFDAWLAKPRTARSSFVIVTPDTRFPQGATRDLQNRTAADDDKALPEGQYFRNRNPGKDQNQNDWRDSQYDHYRFRAFADANRTGAFPLFTRAENDMLAAEGYIRKQDFASAATLIDRTRTAAGLPALTGMVTSATQPVPGGIECVPRVPVGPDFTSTACGTILEAMKWEKRMETAYTTYGAWFFDSRGWGDLAIGTALHWPVPNQELDARILPIYNLGGVDRMDGATESTYGYGVGER